MTPMPEVKGLVESSWHGMCSVSSELCTLSRINNMSIIENKKARFEYHLEEFLVTGIVLEGWEVKSIRAGQIQLTGGYIMVKDSELFIVGLRINPIESVSTHVTPEPDRTRKLLAKKKEIQRFIGKVKESGFTLIPVALHWANGLVKVEIALAKGKKLHDKREASKERDWKREQERLMKMKG